MAGCTAAVRAVVINEMTSPQWAYPNDPALPNGSSAGVASLESFGFFLERYPKPCIQTFVQAGMIT